MPAARSRSSGAPRVPALDVLARIERTDTADLLREQEDARVCVDDFELVLKSRRVIPTRLVEAGFDFHFPNWARAAEDLVEKWQIRDR